MIMKWFDVCEDQASAVEAVVEVANELGYRPDDILGSFIRINAIQGSDRDAFIDLCRERAAANKNVVPVLGRIATFAAIRPCFPPRNSPPLVEQDFVSFVLDGQTDGGLKQLAADYVKAPDGLEAWKGQDLAKYGELPDD